jgi:hypothetical protein
MSGWNHGVNKCSSCLSLLPHPRSYLSSSLQPWRSFSSRWISQCSSMSSPSGNALANRNAKRWVGMEVRERKRRSEEVVRVGWEAVAERALKSDGEAELCGAP